MNYPFELSVYVQRRPHMRDDNLEYVLYAGQGILRQIFDDERVDESVTEAKFYFPERWMNIVEERSLFMRLEKYCPNLKKVEIVTQSVYIIQSTPAGSVKILTSKDENNKIERDGNIVQESVTGRLWYQNVGIPDFSKLQVFS